MMSHSIRPLVVNHWFLIVAPIVLFSNYLVAGHGPIDRVVEFGVLFDLLVLLPALYFLCYRTQRRRAAVRAIALVCLGVWVATKLIPDSERVLLTYVEPLRYAGLAVLVLLEISLVRLVFNSIYSGDSEKETVRKATDASEMPEWVARLLVWEAGVWRRLCSFVLRLFRRH